MNGDWLCIDGRSAGGYTTMAALTFKDVFSAGASLYGVSDLVTLAQGKYYAAITDTGLYIESALCFSLCIICFVQIRTSLSLATWMAS